MVRSLLDRVRARFNAGAAEVGANDLWQRIELGFSVVGNDHGFVDHQLAEIARFIERLALAEVVDERREVMSLKDLTWAPLAAGREPWGREGDPG